jgi:ABC-type Na+ efflux pump permease subunit
VDLRNLLRIARWEVTKNAGGVDRRTAAIAVVAILLMGAMTPLAAAQGVALDRGIYRIGVADSSPYHDVAEFDATFAVRPPDEQAWQDGDLQLLVEDGQVKPRVSPKSRAALDAFRSSVERYNDVVMRGERNQTAAFPVDVILRYETQAAVQERIAIPDEETTTETDEGGGGGESSAGGENGGSGGSDVADAEPAAGGLGGLAAGLTADETTGNPSDIEPPFPFTSLVLAFAFILPLNFLIQAYGSTILSERLKRRGELMLVSPVSRFDIIGGKTLPYFLGALVIEGAIAVGLTYLRTDAIGGLVSLLAITPLILLFLSATFLGAMFARSFKELTFVTVMITVSLTSYAFIPAIFTDVQPIALISPLTLVVMDLQGQAIGPGEFAFSTLPPTLTAVVMFGLGAGLYREEDMFTQRSIPLKVLDALAGRIARKRSMVLLTAMLIPFVFVTELVAVASLYALGGLSIPLLLITVAVVEEVAKSIGVYAGYAHARFDRTVTAAVSVGTLSGLGFFLGEKFTLIARLADLQQIDQGQAALLTGLGPSGVPVVLLLALFLLAPLALHVVTASISAVGASRGRRPWLVGLTLAILIHVGYNLTVVRTIGLV